MMAPIGIRRVLIVDDDAQMTQIMAAVLRISCDEIVTVGTLAAALLAARTKAFALVLLDLFLPDSPGLKTLESIGEFTAAGVPRVVCITGAEITPEIRDAAKLYGAEQVISKNDQMAHHLRALFAS